MRKLFTIMAAALLTATTGAQSPQRISYQAVIRNAAGALVTTQVGMRISILKGSASGTAVYVETQTPTPNVNGIVSIEIGGGTVVSGTIPGIDWAAGPYWVKTEIATAPPLTTYTVTGSSQLLSVPYALYTGHYVGELFGGGIVVSVWEIAGVQHGLIASLADMGAVAVPWSNVTGTLIGATAQSPVDGQTNTTAIIGQTGETSSAAALCSAYTNVETGTGVFTDWYLPAIWELKDCYNAAFVVTSTLGTTNGFTFDFYWSSTEADANNAWYIGFHTNIVGSNAAKGNLGRVRAVRRF